MVINKALVKQKGLIYASLYSQLNYLYELYKQNNKLNDQGYFNYKMKFIADIFQIEHTKLITYAIELEGDKLVKISYSVDFDDVEIKVFPLESLHF